MDLSATRHLLHWPTHLSTPTLCALSFSTGGCLQGYQYSAIHILLQLSALCYESREERHDHHRRASPPQNQRCHRMMMLDSMRVEKFSPQSSVLRSAEARNNQEKQKIFLSANKEKIRVSLSNILLNYIRNRTDSKREANKRGCQPSPPSRAILPLQIIKQTAN